MLYNYKVIRNNKIVTGKVEAANEKNVIEYLKSENDFLIEVKAEDKNKSNIPNPFDQVGFNDVVDFTRQLSIMLTAGLTLIDCFDIMKKQIAKVSLNKVISDIDKEIRGGKSFSYALGKYPRLFSNLYISLVKSGEASGKLSEILLKLADNLEKQREFQGKIKGALIYPVIVVAGMAGVIFVMITFVMPKLLNLYKDFGVELPVTTKMLIIVSNFTAKFWPLIIIGVFGTILAIRGYLRTKPGKYLYDRLLLKIPIISNVIQKSTLVDSTRTLSILIGSGVSILDALNIIIDTCGNLIYRDAFSSIYHQVEKGVSIGSAMTNEGIFPPILVQMTTVGEQTGHLDETLMRISTYFEMESEMAVKAMTTMIEPAILVFLGVGVGFLVLSVLTPIYNLTSSFK
jgi:type IV pilus assembly protein PilC